MPIIRFIALALALIAGKPGSADPVAPAALEGGWEGEARGATWPIFLTLEIRSTESGHSGELLFAGRKFPLDRVNLGDGSIVADGGDGSSRYRIEARAENDLLVGAFRLRDTNYPFSLRRIPALSPSRDRIEAWRQDIDALEQRFGAADRSFSPAERKAFTAALASLRHDLPSLGDPQIIVRMAAAIALSRNAHSRLYLLRNRTELRRMPIRLWWFGDGLYVVRATEAHRDLVGCRVTAIENMKVRRARDIVALAFAGNQGWADYMSVYSLTSPEMLAGFGIAAHPEAIRYRLAGCTRAGTASLSPSPLARSTSPVEAWWDLAPGGPEPAGAEWVQLLDGAAETPLYLRHPKLFYWLDFQPDSGILYVQYNRSANMESETVAQFAERVAAAFDSNPVRALVVDLRFNTGGDLNLAAALMNTLQQRSSGIPRFVVTSRSTFSAGITHAVSWQQSGNVRFVGEPVGDDLDFWAEGGNIILPNSGIAAHFANGEHNYSPDRCGAPEHCLDMNVENLDPDLRVPLSFGDYRSGKDPAMQAITRAISVGR